MRRRQKSSENKNGVNKQTKGGRGGQGGISSYLNIDLFTVENPPSPIAALQSADAHMYKVYPQLRL